MQTRIYTDRQAQQPLIAWLDALKDLRAKAQIQARMVRVAAGNFGDCKPLRDGVQELKIDIGPGYRVYLSRQGPVLVLLLWNPIRQRPGVGTVLNVLLIGPSIEVGLWILPEPDGLGAQILLLAGGLALLAVATGLYIGARFGPGPRDGLMMGIHRRTGLPIWAVRTSIEVAVLAIGWLLGGTVGLGTLAFALLIGPMVGVTLPLLRIPEARVSEAQVPEAIGRVDGPGPDAQQSDEWSAGHLRKNASATRRGDAAQ